MQSPAIKIISAGAGSGKTYRLTEELSELLTNKTIRPNGIIATTFTNKAAAELRERVRVKLLSTGQSQAANELSNALIGTVHGLGVKLLKRFAFEAGVSPQVDIIPDDDQQRLFNLSLAATLSLEFMEEISLCCEKLGLGKADEPHNWRGEVLRIVDMIRSNDLDTTQVDYSRDQSWESLQAFLPQPQPQPDYWKRLSQLMTETADQLENNEVDGTKKTLEAANRIKKAQQQLKRRSFLPWPTVVGLLSRGVGAKSKDIILELQALIDSHRSLPAFQEDLRKYKNLLFDCAQAAIHEFDRYKKSRGQIDYTDMEVLILRLLDQPAVQETLSVELDLLMVDEFQDTSPIQLAIFLRLSQLAKQSIWVGDPKQSIYGFRGADPQLMQAVISSIGGLQPENILDKSWRSREDIVHLCNDIFCRAFPKLDQKAVALTAVRTRKKHKFSPAESSEQAQTAGLRLWQYQVEGGGRNPNQAWYNQMMARSIAELLADPPQIRPKGNVNYRALQAGDIAILVRSNNQARQMAEALHQAGLSAAVARTRLLETAEATLVLACLRYLLNPEDTLAVAELMLLGEGETLSRVIDERLGFLAEKSAGQKAYGWGNERPLPKIIDGIREATQAYAPSEAFNLLLEQIDLRRIIGRWGRGEQRLSNLDELRKIALDYEDYCHQHQQAASLGGLLLYLSQLRQADKDEQASGEGPDAVNVLTYHKSKGLEWPFVICHDLQSKLRANVFGARIIPANEGFDSQRPLAGRWLRYWPQPYGLVKKGLHLLEDIGKSDWQANATQQALGEESRLLYVGFTRARDILCLPIVGAGTGWLDRVYHQSINPPSLLELTNGQAIFTWEEQDIPQLLQTWIEARSLPRSDQQLRPIRFLSGLRPGSATDHQELDLPASFSAATYPGSKIDKTHSITYASVAELDPEYQGGPWSSACRHFILADWSSQPSPDDRLEMARRIGQDWMPDEKDTAEMLIDQSEGLRQVLSDHFGPSTSLQLNASFQAKIGDHRLRGSIDIVVQTEAGLVLLQDAQCMSKKWLPQLKTKAPDLYWNARVYSQIHATPLTASFAWLPARSALYPITTIAPHPAPLF